MKNSLKKFKKEMMQIDSEYKRAQTFNRITYGVLIISTMILALQILVTG